MTSNTLSHFDDAGQAHMVDVSTKPVTSRQATASGAISMSAEAFALVRKGTVAKGDVLGVARLAGIMAAKQVDRLIPLTHPLPISTAAIDFEFIDEHNMLKVIATVGISGKTGVEMEALTAVSVAALTVYDMVKAVDKGMVISDIKLLKKTGGKSGTYSRE